VKKIFGMAVLVSVLWTTNLAMAEDAVQQTITVRVDAINEVSVNGELNTLVISSQKGSAANNATWAVTTNETNKRLVGSIDADMPPGVTLSMELEAPSKALGNGPVVLSTTPQDLVTGISRVAEANLKVDYTLSTERGSRVERWQRVLTLTLTDGF
jgi:hypothetical protein